MSSADKPDDPTVDGKTPNTIVDFKSPLVDALYSNEQLRARLAAKGYADLLNKKTKLAELCNWAADAAPAYWRSLEYKDIVQAFSMTIDAVDITKENAFKLRFQEFERLQREATEDPQGFKQKYFDQPH